MKMQDMEVPCICYIVLKDKKNWRESWWKMFFLYHLLFLFMLQVSCINFCFCTHTYTQQEPSSFPPQTNPKNSLTTVRIPLGFERAGYFVNEIARVFIHRPPKTQVSVSFFVLAQIFIK